MGGKGDTGREPQTPTPAWGPVNVHRELRQINRKPQNPDRVSGVPVSSLATGSPLSSPVPPLSAACGAGEEEVDDVGLTTCRTTVGTWRLQPAPRRSGVLIDFHWGGGRLLLM